MEPDFSPLGSPHPFESKQQLLQPVLFRVSQGEVRIGWCISKSASSQLLERIFCFLSILRTPLWLQNAMIVPKLQTFTIKTTVSQLIATLQFSRLALSSSPWGNSRSCSLRWQLRYCAIVTPSKFSATAL